MISIQSVPINAAKAVPKNFTDSKTRYSHELHHRKPHKCKGCDKGFAKLHDAEWCNRRHITEKKDLIDSVKPDLLTLFGIKPDDVITDILLNKQYKRTLLKYHPDKPGGSHDKAVIIIRRYLVGTMYKGIRFATGKIKGLECYIEANFVMVEGVFVRQPVGLI